MSLYQILPSKAHWINYKVQFISKQKKIDSTSCYEIAIFKPSALFPSHKFWSYNWSKPMNYLYDICK